MNLLSKLPAYRGSVVPVKQEQSFTDIKTEVCRSHYVYTADYDRIASDFWRGSVSKTAQGLFDFCKRYFTYVEESGENQTTRSPAAIISTGNSWGVDCKHYAGFIAGVLDALKRQGKPVNWFYRFVSYDFTDSTPQHVFVVVMDENNNELFVDPVFDSMNARFPVYWYKLDKNCSMLSRVSGSAVGTTILEVPNKLQSGGFVPVGEPIKALPGKILNVTDLPQQKDNTILWLGAAALAIYFFTRKRRR